MLEPVLQRCYPEQVQVGYAFLSACRSVALLSAFYHQAAVVTASLLSLEILIGTYPELGSLRAVQAVHQTSRAAAALSGQAQSASGHSSGKGVVML
ncbi:hypothetical protein D3C71_1811230 [compost metagenome]